MIRKNYLLGLFLFIFFNISGLFSQSLSFEKISGEDGLIHEHILSIYKDSRGFLWIGTYGGIERFDGYEHRWYNSIVDRKTGVQNHTFHCIFEDNKNQLWCGTQGGLYYYDLPADTFKIYQHNPEEPFSISNDNVRSVVQDSEGILWIGTYGGGINKFIPDSGKFCHYMHDSLNSNSLSSDLINMLCFDNNGLLWIATDGGGLVSFNTRSEEFEVYKSNEKNKLKSNIITSIRVDKQNNLWLGTWEGGLSYLDRGTGSFTTYLNVPGDKNSLSNNIVRAINIGSDGYLWLATFGGGLNRFDPEMKVFTIYRNDPFDNNTISFDQIWSLYEDNCGILWIGTFGGGINKYDRNKHKFKHYKQQRKLYGLPSNNITGVCTSKDNSFWIATADGEITKFDSQKNLFQSCQIITRENINTILSVFEDSAGKLWVASDNGILVYSCDKQFIHHYVNRPNDRTSISENSILDICEDSFGNMWFASWNDGVYVLTKDQVNKPAEKAQFINYRHNPDDSTSLAWNIVWVVYCGKQNNIWLGTDKTFDKFNPETNNFSHYDINMVTTIWEENKENLWLGTFGFGLYCFNKETEASTVYTQNNGITNLVILGVLGGKNNDLWMSTEGGLFKFNTMTGKSEAFNATDGLQGNKFNYNAYAVNARGEMLFGGNNGINVFYPESIKKDSSVPELVFTDFKLFNQSVSLEKAKGNNSLLKENLILVDTIFLNHNQSFITIEFAALCFSDAEDVRYKYRLESFDADWHSANSDRRDATYTNLDPGSYIFEVKATNGDGIWNDRIKSLYVIVNPAWYQTILFKIFIIGVIVYLLFLLYRIRIKQIKNRNIQLESIITKRTHELSKKNKLLHDQTIILNKNNAELEERRAMVERQSDELHLINEDLKKANATKDKFFSIIAHDLKNPFNSLLGFIDLLKINHDEWDSEKRSKIIDVLETSARNIYNLLENLLVWSRSQTNRMNFNPKYYPVIDSVNCCLELLKENYIIKDQTVINEISEDTEVYADKDMIDTVVRNLISNAIKYTPVKGIIRIYSETSGNEFNLKVKDSGSGIPEDISSEIFKIGESVTTVGTQGETGSGLGLIICKEFIGLNNGRIDFTTKKDSGTIFTLTFPKFR
ncbi:MAG: hypothetical protein JW894_15950 [Bacteroidales bacterium]|nr:hypothetical protein [Bacteroidales bacterium]